MILLILALCSFNGPNIGTIPTPVSYRDPAQGTWQQSIQVVLGTVHPTTTVIIIPGGPGDTTITPTLPSRYLDMPAAWNTLLTDPRGSGCNVGPPSSTFSTDTLARDVLTVIKSIGLTDYMIYGVSYGTIEATVLENLIEADPSVPRPRAVVLEGCIGRARQSYQEYFQGFTYEWDRVKRDVLKPATVAMFARPPYPLGLSSSDWAILISSQLVFGDLPGSGHALQTLLEPIDQNGLLDALSEVKAASARTSALVLTISCSEINGGVRAGDLVNNELVLSGPDFCSSGLTNPYDSANYPTTVPLYHFQGQFDPIVSPAQSMYHHLTHPGSRSTYVTIGNAGHDPFERSLRAVGCGEPIWTTMASGGSLGPLLASCGLPYALVERGAGQALSAAGP